ncbi:Transcription termination factor 2 [Geodia barretti]|uniref:Transcription termination factor 2 n=1 Tax=Geodia barretti TaxID=519541 RepID=A0AA35XIV0_GEOBA|nr:Transcription termination factor 2 [Geodia barretti]
MAHRLPDGGVKLREQRKMVMNRISEMKRVPPPDLSANRPVHAPSGGDKLFQRGLNLQARLLTSGVVEQLHRSLETCPTADTLAPQPSDLTATLFPHQQRALAWLLWREKQTPSGGILADEMGLGKTLSMISLILQNPSDHSHHSDDLMSSRATLVVCAPSLIHQWAAEIDSRLHRNTLSVLIYHGSKRTKFPQGLADHDVVITTYDTVGAEGASSLDTEEAGTGGKRRRRVASTTTLFQVYWYRVVLDEAHKIRNPKTAMAVGVSGLKKVHRWAVTGTPVQNKLTDLYSLIKFLELAPFDDIREWKHSIERKSVVGMQRLRTMIAVLVLRRSKEDIASTHKLPDKIINTHTLDLGMEEQSIYDALFTEARKVFVRFLTEQRGEGEETDSPAKTNSTGNTPPAVLLPPPVQRCLDNILASFKDGSVRQGAVLVMLLRLRQCCCHPGLMVSGAQDVDLEEGLEEALDSLSLDHVTRLKDVSLLPPPFREQRLSTKICEVLREVRRIRGLDPPEKCIVVSQWIGLLDIARFQLDSAGISWTSIDSRVSPKQRSLNVSSFNSAKPDPAVMLLSMIAGGEGLNLVGGNHVFMLDLHWNPAVELQATDRAHRMGQTRNVHVHRFVCRGTVEEKIQLLQTKKLQLSASVLSGASRPKQGNRLTLQDLKVLFQVE